MKTNDMFEKLKKEYKKITPRKTFRQKGWHELEPLLNKHVGQNFWESPLYRWVTVSAVMLFISTTAVFAAATKAKPGEALYSVRQFSEQFTSLITPKPTVIKELPVIKKPTERTQPTQADNAASKSGKNTQENQSKNITNSKTNTPAISTPTKAIQETKTTIESIKSEEKKGKGKNDETKTEDKKADNHNEKPAEQVEETVKDAVGNTLNGLLK